MSRDDKPPVLCDAKASADMPYWAGCKLPAGHTGDHRVQVSFTFRNAEAGR